MSPASLIPSASPLDAPRGSGSTRTACRWRHSTGTDAPCAVYRAPTASSCWLIRRTSLLVAQLGTGSRCGVPRYHQNAWEEALSTSAVPTTTPALVISAANPSDSPRVWIAPPCQSTGIETPLASSADPTQVPSRFAPSISLFAPPRVPRSMIRGAHGARLPGGDCAYAGDPVITATRRPALTRANHDPVRDRWDLM